MGSPVKTNIHISHPVDGAQTLSFAQPLIRIGRVEATPAGRNDVVLPGEGVSKEHAHLVVSDGEVTVIDRSRNGTFVNSVLLRQPHRLQLGDIIEIDQYALRCTSAAGPSALDLVPPEDDLPSFDGPALAAPLDGAFLGPPDDIPASAPPRRADVTAPPDPRVRRVELTAPPSRPHVDAPRDPHPTPPRREPGLRDPLAAVYRELAAEFGADAWGQPPQATWSSAVEAARRAVARHPALAREPLWPEWLAHELCGAGPLTALLDDAAVTAITVHGTGPIDVRRVDAREPAAARFSCPEAVAAAYARWTGELLADDADVVRPLADGATLTALGLRRAPAGPLLHVVRPRPALRLSAPTREPALPQAAIELLTAAVQRGLAIVVYGEPTAELAPLAAAIAAEIPGDRSLGLVARSGAWPTSRAVALHGPDALRQALRLHLDWVLLEEVHAGDAADLGAAARHAGGGLVCTLRARTAEAALDRLAAMVAATGGAADPATCRAALAHDLDLFVGVRRDGGRARVHAISELRPGGRGELAELFAFKPDTHALEPTHIDCHALRQSAP